MLERSKIINAAQIQVKFEDGAVVVIGPRNEYLRTSEGVLTAMAMVVLSRHVPDSFKNINSYLTTLNKGINLDRCCCVKFVSHQEKPSQNF